MQATRSSTLVIKLGDYDGEDIRRFLHNVSFDDERNYLMTL